MFNLVWFPFLSRLQTHISLTDFDPSGASVLVTQHFLEIVFHENKFSHTLVFQCVLSPIMEEPRSLFREEAAEPWGPGRQSSAETQSLGVCQAGSLHSLWYSVPVCTWARFLLVSSNCFCFCGFLLNDCIIRSHMAKPRPEPESTLSSSFLMARGDSQRIQLLFQT